MQWYALRVKPHKEKSVYQLLQARNIDTFFPTIRVKPKNPRAAKERPYFPGYMFVRADLEELGLNAFSWLPGTSGLVTFGDLPAVVPEHLIHEIKQRLAQHQAEAETMTSLRRGDHVRIVSGPFQGYEAIFDMHLPGKERVQVLLAFLSNHLHPLKLDADHVIKVK